MKVIRKAWVRCVETYELELTDRYVEDLNKYLQEHCTEALPPLTAEDIVDIVNGEDNLFAQKGYTWKWHHDKDQTFLQELGDYVRELVNEDVWDCEYNSEYIDTDDWETRAFKTDEESRDW